MENVRKIKILVDDKIQDATIIYDDNTLSFETEGMDIIRLQLNNLYFTLVDLRKVLSKNNIKILINAARLEMRIDYYGARLSIGSEIVYKCKDLDWYLIPIKNAVKYNVFDYAPPEEVVTWKEQLEYYKKWDEGYV